MLGGMGIRESRCGYIHKRKHARWKDEVDLFIFFFSFPLFLVPPAGGRSPDGPRYPGDWEIKIEPAERKLRKRALVRRSLCARNFIASRGDVERRGRDF